MSILTEIIQGFNWTKQSIRKRHYERKFIEADINRQKKKLSKYKSDVKKIDVCSPIESSLFCIFVYYEMQDEVSRSVFRIISELRDNNINIILLCNHNLTMKQRNFFSNNCHSIIIRGNQGFDFGGYKDAYAYIKEINVNISRIIFMNDSVFYRAMGLKEMVKRLLGTEDVIAAYENWSGSEHHHLQSFCLSISDYVFYSESFRKFWDNYIPINNRVYAIENGEKKLSKAALQNARNTHVIYSTSSLYKTMIGKEFNIRDSLYTVPHPWRDIIYSVSGANGHIYTINKLIEIINSTSPIHAGAYFFPKFLNSPLFKKDIVYRHRFDFWEVETWVPEILNRDELEEFLTIIRKKGDEHKLSKIDKIKYNIGVK